VQYGRRTIEYSTQVNGHLRSHYITVARDSGVVLKGKKVSPDIADKLILKKAGWIVDKLQVVRADNEGQIVTGSRIPYLGKNYYTQVIVDRNADQIQVDFTYSRFIIRIKNRRVSQRAIKAALEKFYWSKAVEKIKPRVEKLAEKTRLKYNGLAFRKMNKRWGSCTADNKIIINPEAIKLPFSLIDYLILHELCHTRVKDHSKAYWAELSKHVPRWRELDKKVKEIKN